MAPRFEDLRAEYSDLWQRMEIRPDEIQAVNKIANHLIGFKSLYQKVSQTTGVPWFVIAALHNRESSADFTTYLGNGEPLNRVTRLVPKGRGPFTSWDAGAVDALEVDQLDHVTDWSPERACYEIEKFNGFGYRNKGMESPYLWSFSNIYQSGKYVADGVFNFGVVDSQCGAMPIIKQIMVVDPTARFQVSGTPAPAGGGTSPLTIGSRGDRVTQLQNALRQRGYSVGDVDGIYGSVTRDAVTAFQRDAKLAPTGVADETTLHALAVTVAPQPFDPADLLRLLFSELGKAIGSGQATAGSTPSGSSSGAAGNVLRQILGAFVGMSAAQTTASAGAPVAPPQVILSPIDKMLGGEALTGKKTALAIVAYAVMAILQAAGVVGSATPAGMIINTIIAAFGGLGALSKIDRVIQALGIIAAKRPG